MIRPNRATLGLAGVMLAMLYAGLSQNNPPAYLLAYLLLALAAVSALHAWTNLQSLEVIAEPITAVFEGEAVPVPLLLRATSKRRHFGITLRVPGSSATARVDEVPPGESRRAELFWPAPRRGRYEAVDVEVASHFPLGFFTASRRVTLSQPYYVYPRPEGDLPLPADDLAPVEATITSRREGDDFAGTRDWQSGESMRHVDWKAVARGQRLMVKQWAGGANPHFRFDAAMLADLPLERRLRQLARWVVQAERLSAAYELHLPWGDVPLGRGERQLELCLQRLADAPRPTAASESAEES